MRVCICPDAANATARVVELIADQVRARPASVLGLATGGTMEGVYDGLRAAHAGGLSFAQVTTFNLDEYVGLPPDHPQSYSSYMRHHLFDRLDVPEAARFVPSGLGDPAQAAVDYEAALARLGPIDLQLLGLGRNGHIGFNEPGSGLSSRTREKVLTRDTLAANARFFAAGETLPTSAITMGVGTIRDARRIVLLALGANKAAAAAAMIEGPVAAFCPASVLQFHPAVTVVLDPAAASLLTLADHYRHAEAAQFQRETKVSEKRP